MSGMQSQSRQSPFIPAVLLALLSAVFYILSKKVLIAGNGGAATWFADAVAIAFLYRHRYRHWPLLIAAFLSAIIAAGVGVGFGILLATLYALACLSAVLPAALLLCRFCPREDYFDGLWPWARFTLLSAVLPPIGSAAVGAAVADASGRGNFSEVFAPWYIADAVGILVLLPIALQYRWGTLHSLFRGADSGRFLLVGALAISSILLILSLAPHPFVFASLPLIWAASRLKLLHTLAVIFVAILLMSTHFAGVDRAAQGDGFALFLAVFASAIPAYVMAVSANIERHRNARIVEIESDLSYRASHDDLTGLPNREAFKRELLQAIGSARESGERHALVHIDLDGFKLINDSAGHLAGDALLQKISRQLGGLLDGTDRVARLGGDEFGLLFFRSTKEQARGRCEELLRGITALRFPWRGRVYGVGASAGITEINRHNSRLEDLLSQADVACYSAKRAGRGSVMLYEIARSAAAEQHREIIMASTIREALDRRRLALSVQPIVRAADVGSVDHYEILVRMLNDRGELLMPAAFIPAAERYGLMLQVDHWVVDEILLRRADQVAGAGFSFSLNISAEALGDSEFQRHLIEMLEHTPIPMERIGFEITETAMVNQMGRASEFVASLRRMGCKVALDDFGNGLSSFSYLKAFAIDFIKIDGSFVREMESNLVDPIIVESINQVAHRLGARTIAEYVESASVAALLRSIGVDFVQGYHIGPPISLERLLYGGTRLENSRRMELG